MMPPPSGGGTDHGGGSGHHHHHGGGSNPPSGGGTDMMPPPSGGGTDHGGGSGHHHHHHGGGSNPPPGGGTDHGGGSGPNPTVTAVNDVNSVTVDHLIDGFTPRPTDRSAFFDEDETSSTGKATPTNPITGNVLTNDSDSAGNPLSVTNAGTFDLGHGSLVLAANGAYTYTVDTTNTDVNNLAAGNTLTDTFTYDVSDGHGGMSSATLTITINSTGEQENETQQGLNNVSYNLLQGDGDDKLIGGNNTVTNELRADAHGNDLMYGGDGANTHNYMIGGSDATNDMYGGNNGATNFIYGGGGNQWIFGGHDATNNIWGGGGQDKIVGGDHSTNTIYGGTGDDTITGGNNATNLIYTETGSDIVHGGDHSTNTIYGGPGHNQLFGGTFSTNTIFGGGGDDTIAGGDNSTNLIYGGGGNDVITGGNHSSNTYYAEWGNTVTITGGDNAENTFFDGGGNDTYIGGLGDNFFVFNDFKYPLGSQGVQGNTTVPVALANQSVTTGFQFISGGTDVAHGNVNSTDNVVELKGPAGTWTINVTDPIFGVHNATDGSWTALTGHTLEGTITSSVNGAAITFDHINQIKFIP
jgi:VCBS repeat-containing protein